MTIQPSAATRRSITRSMRTTAEASISKSVYIGKLRSSLMLRSSLGLTCLNRYEAKVMLDGILFAQASLLGIRISNKRKPHPSSSSIRSYDIRFSRRVCTPYFVPFCQPFCPLLAITFIFHPPLSLLSKNHIPRTKSRAGFIQPSIPFHCIPPAFLPAFLISPPPSPSLLSLSSFSNPPKPTTHGIKIRFPPNRSNTLSQYLSWLRERGVD